MMMDLDKATADRIRSELKGGEKDLPVSILQLIYQKKLFRLFLPAELDGLQLSLPEALQVIRYCSYIDGDFGWQVNIGAGGGFFAGYIDPGVVRERFKSRDFVIAGSGIPAGSIKKSKEDGYVVNGSWKYCSGSGYATLFTFNCMTPDGEMKAVALNPDQVRIIEDWDAYGLSATSSHSVVVEDAKVPEARTFDVTRKKEDWGYPLFDYPFVEFARASFFATISGCYRHFIEEIGTLSKDIAGSQKEKHLFLTRLTGDRRDEFDRNMEAHDKIMKRSWNELVETGSIETATLDSLNTLILDSTRRIHQSAAEILFYTGMAGIRSSSPINKVWCDLSTASQHSMLKEYSD